MYIKLGETRINYNTQETLNKYTIVGQVINSPTSYENPILVNSDKELDIWFSKDFTDRDYFLELLNKNVTLYLYKPISTKSVNMNGDCEFVNYNNWDTLVINNGLVNELMISLFFIMKTVEKGGSYKYRVLSSDKTNFNDYIWKNNSWILYFGNDINYLNENEYFNEDDLDCIAEILSSDQFKIPVINSQDDFWIWLDGRFVVTSQLPQNLENFSESLNNRDTLTITDSELIPYTHPEFEKIDKIGVYSETNVDLDTDAIDLDRINSGKDTLVFRLKSTYTDKYSNLYFVIIDVTSGESHLYYSGDLGYIPSEVKDFCVDYKQLFPGETTTQEYLNKLADEFELQGYTINRISLDEFTASSPKPIKVTYFNNIPGLVYESDKRLSYNIISKKAIDDNSNVIEFWSKTIGGTDHDEDRISINIEKVEIEEDNDTNIDIDPFYRITISKYNYTETFEAPTRPLDNRLEERLDYVISRKSKLVYCSINKPGNRIKEGDYVLRGGRNESKNLEWSEESWRKSLSVLFDDQTDPVYPDFFLIPNINNFSTTVNVSGKYYTYYEKLLEYATNFNCQFLIQNNESSIWSNICLLVYNENPADEYTINASSLDDAFEVYKTTEDIDYNTFYYVISDVDNSSFCYVNNRKITIEDLDTDPVAIRYSMISEAGNDYVFNYTKDVENRLVYFYNPIFVDGEYRPGYYLFIEGLLTGKVSMTVDRIIYRDPVREDESVYEDSKQKLLLEAYKSNYLINNNIVYFYKNYQNGVNPKPKTTILFRFIAGKIQRELLKNKWEYLGEKNLSKVQDSIELVLKRIRETYSIVQSLELIKFLPDIYKNKLDLEMEVRLDDLVNKDITIDVTVDFTDLTN